MKVLIALFIAGLIATNIFLNSDLISTTSAGYELPVAWENHEPICYESPDAVPKHWFIAANEYYYEENGCFYEVYEVCNPVLLPEPGIPFKYQRQDGCNINKNNLAYYLDLGIIASLFPFGYIAVRKVRRFRSPS